jgi:histidinol phosphatase-like PHP family hydrolase
MPDIDINELGSLDLHAHTNMSDGDLPLARVVEIAESRGVKIGIADHISSRNFNRFISTEKRLRNYLDAIERFPVFRSGELCWCDDFGAAIPPDLLGRFDYLIGSNHGFPLPNGTLGSPWWSTLPGEWTNNPHGLMDIMVDSLCGLVREMPVQIIAHSTLMPPALLRIEPDVEEWWTDEREDRFVDAFSGSEVAMEISNRYRLPHDRVLKKAKEAGVRFSLGSDGHNENQIGRLDWALATARRIGITPAGMFVPDSAN